MSNTEDKVLSGDQEFLLTEGDFNKIARLLREATGIFLPPTKSSLVYSRLSKRLRKSKVRSFRQYISLIEQDTEERGHMISALTTNVTNFFREPHHFNHFEKATLPPLVSKLKSGGKVRIWSAACSSGQEAYSMALSILRLIPDAPRYDIKILATDIDPLMIRQGISGVYSDRDARNIPSDLRAKWFDKKDGGSFIAKSELRDLIIFKELNLLGQWPMRGKFDAIFCRNVVIYFEEETQKTLWTRFITAMEPDAFLYIGHSERVIGEAAEYLHHSDITTYQYRGRS